MTHRLGVFVPQGWRMDLHDIGDPIEQYEAMTKVAQTADSLSVFDSIWLYDHFHTVPVPSKDPTFEAWTSTAALARDTKRVNVGQMVTCNSYRNPALLAKMASTVDVMSHGRLYFGLGAGWHEHEYNAYGFPFLETPARMRAFREACQIVHAMWTEDEPVVKGQHYQIDKPINEPKGARKPHPSFWIGGSGEQVTLKLVAQYGDASNTNGDVETVRHKLGVLRGHCEKLGRDYESLIRSTTVHCFPLAPGEDGEKATLPTQKATGMSYENLQGLGVVGTPEVIAQTIRDYLALGINYVIVNIVQVAYDLERMHRFATEVAPKLG